MPNKIISKEEIEATKEIIRTEYYMGSAPWVIGYSGGKDSTCMLQLIWYSLKDLDSSLLTKPIYVISSDTLVETPAVVNQLENTLSLIANAAREQNLPIQVAKVIPEVNNTFWVNMIGRGYPAPYTSFRWCTDRMKIQPTTKFIKEQISHHGEVMILLGARKEESASRAQAMRDNKVNRNSKGRNVRRKFISRHKDIGSALVFTPIENWKTDDVWTYIINTKNPWGGNNRDLVTMYRNAQAGECPLVIDKSTPSCGGGRFGCWTCTVVERDRSMEAMIENGNDWLQPMLDLRDWLTETQDPEGKAEIREHRRRNGRIEFREPKDSKGKRKLIWGPFKFEFRKEILRRLLKAQKDVRENGPDPDLNLIQADELHKIRQIWLHEEGDWNDSLPTVYKEVIGESLQWIEDDFSGLGGAEKEILKETADEADIPIDILVELFDLERELHGMSRRAGIYARIDQILGKDWRTREEVFLENKAGKQLNASS